MATRWGNLFRAYEFVCEGLAFLSREEAFEAGHVFVFFVGDVGVEVGEEGVEGGEEGRGVGGEGLQFV